MKRLQISSKKIGIHAICWVLFIVYEVSVSVHFGDQSSIGEYACFYILNILLFYVNAHVVFNGHRKKTLPDILALLVLVPLEIFIYVAASTVLNNVFSHQGGLGLFLKFAPDVVIMSLWRAIYFFGLSIAYWAVLNTIRTMNDAQQVKMRELEMLREKEMLEKENIKLQNAYLQARINPHFLFNALNFIYNQVEEGHPEAPKNVVLLSEIMQYSLSTAEPDGMIPLHQEIDHIRRYIELNQNRFSDTLFLNNEIKEVVKDAVRIPPLLLLTFVENVFKHGDMTDQGHPGIIRIIYEEGQLRLYTENKMRKSRNGQRTHMGIENARTRLKNYYREDDVNLTLEERGVLFILNLNIRL